MSVKTVLLHGSLSKTPSKKHFNPRRHFRSYDLSLVKPRNTFVFSLNLFFLGTFCLLMATASLASDFSTKAIYGVDNRLDPDHVTNSKHLKWYEATAAMIHKDKLKKLSYGKYEIIAQLFGERYLWASGRSAKICKDERFTNQPQASVCSGFLVSSNLLVTAGHCITNQKDCDDYKWVFDYKADSKSGKVSNLDSSSVYSCKKIVDRKLTSKHDLLSIKGESITEDDITQDDLVGPNDYALIELTKKVTGRKALKVRKKVGLEEETKLVLIGYPSGLPAKISAGAEVKQIFETYFESNLDAFGGNSGSAVINESSGEVEGILVRGRTDYVYDFANSCARPAKFDDNDTSFESSTLITNISALADLEDPQEPEPPKPPKPPRRVRRCFLWWCWYVNA